MERCMICSNACDFYFDKNFPDYEFLAKYYKCSSCGFVFSPIHQTMSEQQWKEINHKYHSYHGQTESPDDKRWALRIKIQADLIKLLNDKNIIKNGNWVDYGCGDGKLSSELNSKYNKNLLKYEIDFKGKDYISEKELFSNKYSLITLTSVIEHLQNYSSLEKIFNLLDSTSCLALHTFISETVPKNPGWFYLLPVHCSFYTNKSMQILFDRYNFNYCAYNYDARMWFLFKNLTEEEKEMINKNFIKTLISSNKFVDYLE